MNKTKLLIKHEFLTMVKRKGFIIMTLIVPVIALIGLLAARVIPTIINSSTPTVQNIGYIDHVGSFTKNESQGALTLVKYGTEDEAKAALLNKDIVEYLVIPSDYISSGLIQRYGLKNEIEMSGIGQTTIRDFLLANLLQGNTPEVIARAKAPMNIVSTTLTGTGEVAKQQGGISAMILAYLFAILLLMSIFSSSGYLLQGLGEEKENRVMEILLSSVSSGQLLVGKVIGLGAGGLLQIVIWMVSAGFIMKLALDNFSTYIGVLNITPEFLVVGLIYFILGYLLVAVSMAGAGAIAPTAREGQQMSVLFTLPVIVPIYFMALIMEHPENVVVKILTFIPITSPITVMMRLGLSEIPVWELAVSIVLMILSIIGCFILAGKLFRTYLLMYGKRPDLKEVFRSFRNA
ncbi:MAG: ABC transporter permease [Dehalococcoidales bacterium]|nr:ABC transporter permease [Dehalococcoidales bacterium]